jgi:hypothetical protein
MMQHKKEVSMPHVDEGTLHAYLDGELPSTERAALDAHIAQCEACRARLAEERALIERASTLLGTVRPLERPAPPFEQLRRETRRSPWRVRTSFAWAASLALALGVGYYLHDVGNTRAPETAFDGRTVAVRDEVAQNRSAQEKAPPTPAPADAELRGNVNRPKASARRETDEQERQKPSAAQPAVPAPNLGRFDSSGLRVAARAAPRVAAPDRASAAPAPTLDSINAVVTQVPPATAARMQEEVVLSERKASVTAWPRIDRQTAKAILGEDPVGLPDLTTRSYRRSPDRDGVVLVEQQLDDRTVIQIFQQQSTRASSRLDSLVAGGYGYTRAFEQRQRADRLARFVGKLRVEIGGPVSVDSLNRLLEQVVPLP